MPDFVTSNNDLQSIDNDHQSIFKETYHEHENERNEQIAEVDLKFVNELIIEENVSIRQEIEERNVYLQDKISKNSQLDIDGIMNLSSLNLTDNDIPFIIQQIFQREENKCNHLILRDNQLTSIGVKKLVDELLKTPTNLKHLGLSSNPNIGDEGIKHLVRLLEENRTINILALHNTGITDRGVRLLANVLCNTNTESICPLEKLYISFNKSITDQSLESFLQILEQNQILKVLSLQYCSLSDKARKRLRIIGKKKKKRFSLAE